MPTYIQSLIKKLNSLNWDNLQVSFPLIENLLNEMYSTKKENLQEYLKNITPSEFRKIADQSAEATTHYKWVLYSSRKYGYSIRLHEYKNIEMQREGYANTIHNHRYWFASLILNGGYRHRVYPSDVFVKKEINFVSDTKYSKGNHYYLNPEVIHSVNEVEKNTLTLIITSKAVRDFSTSLDISDNRVIDHYHFTSRFDSFKNLLG
ncbi:MAG TPA: hypothetical protein VF540_10095 [Segetibacter sp.]|jgi:uncharacterized protein YlzI (FlbEa/FlbD family)